MEKGHRWWFVVVSDEERASFSLSLSLSMERDLSLLTYLEQARPGGHGDPACGRSGASESDARELLQKTKNEKSEKKTDAHTQKTRKKKDASPALSDAPPGSCERRGAPQRCRGDDAGSRGSGAADR